MDPDIGPKNLDPQIRIRIWVLPVKTDLDPGPPKPGLDPTRCHP